MWELRSIVAVFRHGDRTPKQKMKIALDHQGFLDFFEPSEVKQKELKFKSAKMFDKVRELATNICEQTKLVDEKLANQD
jgi:inositol-hexakisphosphate/diphosphoinositol-pentakisphosphate 1-kinase